MKREAMLEQVKFRCSVQWFAKLSSVFVLVIMLIMVIMAIPGSATFLGRVRSGRPSTLFPTKLHSRTRAGAAVRPQHSTAEKQFEKLKLCRSQRAKTKSIAPLSVLQTKSLVASVAW